MAFSIENVHVLPSWLLLQLHRVEMQDHTCQEFGIIAIQVSIEKNLRAENKTEAHPVFRNSGAASWQHPGAAASERQPHCLYNSAEGPQMGRAAEGMPQWQQWR